MKTFINKILNKEQSKVIFNDYLENPLNFKNSINLDDNFILKKGSNIKVIEGENIMNRKLKSQYFEITIDINSLQLKKELINLIGHNDFVIYNGLNGIDKLNEVYLNYIGNNYRYATSKFNPNIEKIDD